MRRLLLPLALAVLLAAGMVGVASRTRGPPADLVWTAVAEVRTLDPARMTAVQDGRAGAALYEGLTVLDPRTLAPRPGVAERWDVSDDGLTYTFHLRPEARWSDGRPVTAGDFAYAWRRVLEPETAAEYVYMLWPIRGAKAWYEARAAGRTPPAEDLGIRTDGARRLVVELESPTAYFLSLAAFSTCLPVRRDAVEDEKGRERPRWTFPPNLISNGAYRLVRWAFRSHMRWERNPHYWNADAVALDAIETRVYEEPTAGLMAYETGALDLLTSVPPLVVQPLREARDAGRRKDVLVMANLATYFYRFNCTRPPFDDVRVRRALALAIDRRAIIERAARGGQMPATTFVPPGFEDYPAPPGLDEDAEAARALLAGAGAAGDAPRTDLVILVNKGGGHVPVAEMIQAQWRDRLGISARIEQVEWKVFLDKVHRLDYQIARAGWFGDYVDPNTFLDMFVAGGGNNDTGWSSAAYDEAIRRAAAERDPETRLRTLAEAEAVLLAEVPIVPIYHYTSALLVRPGLRGIYPNLLNRIDFSLVRWERKPAAPSP